MYYVFDISDACFICTEASSHYQELLQLPFPPSIKKKERLNSIIRALVFCGRQSITLRGRSDENLPLSQVGDYKDDIIVVDPVNRGNFIQVLELRRQSGDVRVDKFVNRKAVYTSPAIQNELLQLVG